MWEMIGTSNYAGTTGYPPKETIFNPYFIPIWSGWKNLKLKAETKTSIKKPNAITITLLYI